MRTAVTSFCISLAGAGIALAQTAPDDCAAKVPGTPLPGVNPAAPRILDLRGARTVELHVFGHSENRGYHRYLQPLLDQAPPLPGVRFVVSNHWIGGHEAFEWARPGTRGYAAIEAVLRSGSTHPKIALCLFSNNATYPIRRPDPSDANFRRFVANLDAIADHLRANGKGFSMAYFSSHRYKPRNFWPAFHERAATTWFVEAAGKSKKGWIKAGPEQHDLHWCCYPSCYAPDRAHTNAEGDRLMARAWYGLLTRELTGSYAEPFGKGVAGSGGVVPALSPVGYPRLGNATFALRAHRARARAAAIWIAGTARAAAPLLVRPDLVLPATTDASGRTTLAVPIPLDHRLRGAQVHFQTGVQDAAGSFFGFALTQGLTIVPG